MLRRRAKAAAGSEPITALAPAKEIPRPPPPKPLQPQLPAPWPSEPIPKRLTTDLSRSDIQSLKAAALRSRRPQHVPRQWLTVTSAGWKISNAPPEPIKFAIRAIEAPPIAPSLAPSGLKEFKDEKHEMQQAHASYKPKKRRGAHGSLELETNMAAFEHEDRHNNRPPSANMGYSSIKSMFRR